MEGGGSEGNERWRMSERSDERGDTRITSRKPKTEGGGRGTRRGKEDAIAALVKRDIQSWGFVRTLVR